MTYDEAINEIRKYSGVQFDPKVVDIFLDIVDVEKIKKA
jgi:response regulator RpfG family c-di-GMP phosphodiesterase